MRDGETGAFGPPFAFGLAEIQRWTGWRKGGDRPLAIEADPWQLGPREPADPRMRSNDAPRLAAPGGRGNATSTSRGPVLEYLDTATQAVDNLRSIVRRRRLVHAALTGIGLLHDGQRLGSFPAAKPSIMRPPSGGQGMLSYSTRAPALEAA